MQLSDLSRTGFSYSRMTWNFRTTLALSLEWRQIRTPLLTGQESERILLGHGHFNNFCINNQKTTVVLYATCLLYYYHYSCCILLWHSCVLISAHPENQVAKVTVYCTCVYVIIINIILCVCYFVKNGNSVKIIFCLEARIIVGS